MAPRTNNFTIEHKDILQDESSFFFSHKTMGKLNLCTNSYLY